MQLSSCLKAGNAKLLAACWHKEVVWLLYFSLWQLRVDNLEVEGPAGATLVPGFFNNPTAPPPRLVFGCPIMHFI